MFETIGYILRFNKIVLTLRLLGYHQFTDAGRQYIWASITMGFFGHTIDDRTIVDGILRNY